VENEVDEVVINLYHKPNSIVSAVRERSWPLEIHFSHEDSLLGTAGGVKKVEKHFRDGTFVMVNSDSVFEIDLGVPLAYHREKRALATMVLREKGSQDAYGTVRIDKEGRILGIESRGESEGYLFTGMHVFEPDIFEWIPSGSFCEINRAVYPLLIRKGQSVWGLVTNAFWAEIGSHRTYLQAHRDFLVRSGFALKSESDLPARVKRIPPVLVGRDCHIEEEAQIGPLAVVGHHCSIAQGAIIEDSAVWHGVIIGPGAHVRGSILGHGTVVETGTLLEDVVVCGAEQRRID
jgi:NDP-sugar pyrophosphorylase family protein